MQFLYPGDLIYGMSMLKISNIVVASEDVNYYTLEFSDQEEKKISRKNVSSV